MSDRSLDQTGQMGGSRATRHLLLVEHSDNPATRPVPDGDRTKRIDSNTTEGHAGHRWQGLRAPPGTTGSFWGQGFEGAPEVVRRSTITNR